MEFVNTAIDFLKTLIAFLGEQKVSIPMSQLFAFVILNSFCILFGKHKLGLLVSYCFVIYWGFVINMPLFVDMLGNTTLSLPVFAFSALAFLVLIVIGLLKE